MRTWLNSTLFADGELVIGFAKADAAGREVLASGNICANARCNAIQATSWASASKKVVRVTIAEDASRLASVNLNYWFYGCTALTSITGAANLRGVARMEHAFNICPALAELDLRGMSPSALASLTYALGACTSLTRILADAGWELPKGCAGSATFYNCKALVGGNGTAFDFKLTTYAMYRIDREEQAGYLTVG